MTVERHLILHELVLPPSAEWPPRSHGWLMARVAEGTGYWLQPGTDTRQLTAGDGLTVIRNANGVIRVSQLGPLKLQFFIVQPQYLNGLLTVTEWHQLENAPQNSSPPVSFFSADEPMGQRFTRLAGQPHSHRLLLRCALLQLWASAVASWLAAPVPVSSGGHKLRDRFRELAGQMTETVLSESSLSELARQLHCSERHFSRLFREEFGVSFRARQIELRLQRARQLLADSDAKIINVAYDSGFRHLGLFNAMFKKRFGLTPSEWRQQNLNKKTPAQPRNHLSRVKACVGVRLAILGLFFSLPAFAQTNAPVSSLATDGAAILQRNTAPRFDVQAYAVQGGPLLTTNALAHLFSRGTGTNGNWEAIGEAALALQSEYRNQGYPAMSIAITPDRITNGIVTMNVFYAASPQILVLGKRYAGSVIHAPVGLNLPAATPASLSNASTVFVPTNVIPTASNETVAASSATKGHPGSGGSEPVNSSSLPALPGALAASVPTNVVPVIAIPPKVAASPEEIAQARAALFQKMAELDAQEKQSAHPRIVSTNAGPRFDVEKYLILGNTILSPDTIGGVFTNVDGAFGTNVSFDGVRAALTDLQMAYRERGYVTVSVGLPPQKLTNATVRVQVTEGRLAAIRITGNRYFSDENVMRVLPSLHTNMLLNSQVFQRELDTANASRDRQIYPVIGPGPEPGTSELALKVKDRLPLHARLEVNNTHTPNTPDLRANFNAQYDNLWDLEHQIGLQYNFSFDDYRATRDHWFSPFDDPQIVNYSGYYRLPLGHTASVQEQIETNPGRFGYNEVTHQFNLPPATGRPELTFYASRSVSDTGVQRGPSKTLVDTTGTNSSGEIYHQLLITSDSAGQNITLNEDLGLRLALPLPQVGKISATLSLGVDFKRYRQTSYNTNENFIETQYYDQQGNLYTENATAPMGEPPLLTGVDYFPLNVGLNGSIPDKFGVTFFNANASFNLLPIGSEESVTVATNVVITVLTNGTTTSVTNEFHVTKIVHGHSLAGIAYTPSARPHYVTLQLGCDRAQTIYKNWSVKLHADGQWANTPLIGNEQYGMGGSASVRGYTDGEFYGDTGWRVSIEPQTPLINIGMVGNQGHEEPCWVRSSVFMDYGEAYLFEPPASGASDHARLWGVGWNLTANIGSHLDARLTVACPLLATTTTPVGDVHVYFGVGAQF